MGPSLDAPVGTSWCVQGRLSASVEYADELFGLIGVGVLIIRDEADSVVLASGPLADGFVVASDESTGRVLVAWRQER